MSERLLQKFEALVRKALDEGSPEEERRTSALLAVELWDKHRKKFVVLQADEAQPSTRTEKHIVIDLEEWEKLPIVESFAQFVCRCESCSSPISLGERIWWKFPGMVWHLGCFHHIRHHQRGSR